MASDLSLYLASKSPRRKDILEQLGFHPIVIASNDHTLRNFQGDEVQLPNEAPEDYVKRIAREKNLIALNKIQAQALPLLPVLSADTTVIADGLILGKPNDEIEARDFLRRLSGKEHEVRTAVSEESEALGIHHVACADLHTVAVPVPYPGESELLPLGEALAGIYAQHVGSGLYQCRNTLHIVTCVYACSDNIALV